MSTSLRLLAVLTVLLKYATVHNFPGRPNGARLVSFY